MTDEQLFCKLFPEYVYNGKSLSPYFDVFVTGYEQAENRHKELEKENAELKEHIENIYVNYCGNCNINILNTSLKKENDEPNEQNRSYEQLIDKGSATLMQEKLKNYKQLTKAKELIEKLLNAFASNDFFEEEELDAMAEAEQFIEEIK